MILVSVESVLHIHFPFLTMQNVCAVSCLPDDANYSPDLMLFYKVILVEQVQRGPVGSPPPFQIGGAY